MSGLSLLRATQLKRDSGSPASEPRNSVKRRSVPRENRLIRRAHGRQVSVGNQARQQQLCFAPIHPNKEANGASQAHRAAIGRINKLSNLPSLAILLYPNTLRSKIIGPLRLDSNFVLASQRHGKRCGLRS